MFLTTSLCIGFSSYSKSYSIGTAFHNLRLTTLPFQEECKKLTTILILLYPPLRCYSCHMPTLTSLSDNVIIFPFNHQTFFKELKKRTVYFIYIPRYIPFLIYVFHSWCFRFPSNIISFLSEKERKFIPSAINYLTIPLSKNVYFTFILKDIFSRYRVLC